jgi:hypothetical protein
MDGNREPIDIHDGQHMPRVRAAHREHVQRQKTRRRFRRLRRHTPHYYFVVTGVGGATVVGVLDGISYFQRSVYVGTVAFAAVLVTALVIFAGFFWGFSMAIRGKVPQDRLKYVIPHGAVGMLAPLLYTLNISLALDTAGNAPVNGGVLLCGVLSWLLLLVQFSMGKAVAHRPRLRLVK